MESTMRRIAETITSGLSPAAYRIAPLTRERNLEGRRVFAAH